MGGWLKLTQQGLSPCKKYKTSWRSFTKKLPNYLPGTPSLFLFLLERITFTNFVILQNPTPYIPLIPPALPRQEFW